MICKEEWCGHGYIEFQNSKNQLFHAEYLFLCISIVSYVNEFCNVWRVYLFVFSTIKYTKCLDTICNYLFIRSDDIFRRESWTMKITADRLWLAQAWDQLMFEELLSILSFLSNIFLSPYCSSNTDLSQQLVLVYR